MNNFRQFEPKLITVFREGYSSSQFINDVVAGIIVGIVALPLAIAFAIASGVKPEQGLYTAIIAGFVIAFFGGSRVQVSGPTGAFIVVVYQIVQDFGYSGLALATLLAGVILVVMGFSGMGVLLRFIPYPLTVGFTSGIALIIFSSQISDFFGLTTIKLPASFLPKWGVLLESFDSINWNALGIGTLSILVIFIWPRITKKIPGPLVAIILATLLVYYLKLPVETIGSRFGAVSNTLPSLQSLPISWEGIVKIFPAAITIALLGAIESLLSAVVADGMLGTRHRSNTELVAQGLGNIASALFMGIPATGAIARTGTNIRSGGRTPIAAIIHCLVLVLIMLFFGKLAALIPMATLAAILIFVAYNMSEWRTFKKILSYPSEDVKILLLTFALTVLVDLTVAIGTGVVVSAFFFLKKIEKVSGTNIITEELKEVSKEKDINNSIKPLPEGVEVFEVFGPLFFTVIERFKTAMKRVEKAPKVLILRMEDVPLIDGSGIQAIESLSERTKREKGVLILAEVKDQPLRAIKKSGIISSDCIFVDYEGAIDSAKKIVEGK